MSNIDLSVWSLFERMHTEIEREIRVMLREKPLDQYLIDLDPVARIEVMRLFAEAASTDAERHDFWVKTLLAQGWTAGPALDFEAKTNPNLVLWSELPASVRCKAKVFGICARYAKLFAELQGGSQ